jgi:hypothetical protein
LAGHFSGAQILDIIGIQSAYLMLATIINSLGLELDASVQRPPGYSADTWSPRPLADAAV